MPKISELQVLSSVADTDYTIVYQPSTGKTKRATKLDFKGDKGDQGVAGPRGYGSDKRTFSWVIKNPVTGGILGPRLPEGYTVIRVDSYCSTATSVTFNIEERSVPGSAGVSILTGNQVADTNGESSTDFANSSLAADSWLYLNIIGVVGFPEQLVVTLSCTI